MTLNSPSEFWNGEYLRDIRERPESSRICIIVRGKLRHDQKRHRLTFEEALRYFSATTNVPLEDVVEIVRGRVPSRIEIDKISGAFNWSTFFLFGISASQYSKAEKRFFEVMGDREPLPSHTQAFKALWEEMLLLKANDEANQRA